MLNKILDLYKNINMEMDFNIIKDVQCDNVFEKLNELTKGYFSYDADVMEVRDSGVLLVKVTIATPIKVVVGYANVFPNDLSIGIKQAAVIACENGFDFGLAEKTQFSAVNAVEEKVDYQMDLKSPEYTEHIAATTLEELEAIEKEIAAGTHINKDEIIVIDKGDVEFKPDPVNTTTNPYGIREDQINFMKKFQEMFSIDTTEKFDAYVIAWSHQQSIYSVNTKKELISSGPQAVDAFISWVKEVNQDNVESKDFVAPSDEEWDQFCGN